MRTLQKTIVVSSLVAGTLFPPLGVCAQGAPEAVPPAAPPIAPSVSPQSAPPSAPGFFVYPSNGTTAQPPAGSAAPSVTTTPPPALPLDGGKPPAVTWAEFVAGFDKDPFLKTLNALLAPSGWTTDPASLIVRTASGYATTNGASASSPNGYQTSWLQEYGCTHIWTKTFQRTQRAAYINVYCFNTPEAAYGAYSTMRVGSSNVIVRGAASSEDENSISFWKGKRFVVLTSKADEDDVSKTLLTSLANSLAKDIDETSAKPELITSLPVWDRVPGSEKMFMGTQTARRSVMVPHLQALSIDRSRGAAFAEYKFPAPLLDRMKALIIDYGDIASARSAYSTYTGLLNETHKLKPVDVNAQLCKVNDTYMLVSLKGPRVIIISGAHKKASPLVLSRQLAY